MLDRIIEVFLLGSFYCSISIGLNFIFGITKIINFAHGEILMIGAMIAYYLSTCGMNPFLTIPISMLLTFALGSITYKTAFEKISQNEMSTLISSMGLSYTLMTIVRILLGAGYKIISLPLPSISFFGYYVSLTRLMIAIIALATVIITHFFLKKSLLGLKIRAVAQSTLGATLVGIDVNKIRLLSFAIGFSLTGIGGVLMGLLFAIHPYMGGFTCTLAFLIVIFGGLGSFLGTIIGSFVFAFIQQLTILILNPGYTYAVAFICLAAVLILRKEGILGGKFAL